MKLESIKSYKTQACKCLGGHSPFHLHPLGRTSHWNCTWLGSCLLKFSYHYIYGFACSAYS